MEFFSFQRRKIHKKNTFYSRIAFGKIYTIGNIFSPAQSGDEGRKARMTQELGRKPSHIWKQMRNDWLLYLLLLPVIAWYIIFSYLPMAGVVLAFKDYSFRGGIWGSPWVGLANFTKMFSDPLFFRAVKNTIIFSVGRIIFQTPCAILLALLLNEIRFPKSKKVIQTIVTFPHFISWVVLAGMMINLFGSTGIINRILGSLGLESIAPRSLKCG